MSANVVGTAGPKGSGGGHSSRPLWQEAISLAARAHRHQIRKDDRTPYIAHCVRVMTTLSQVFGCRDEGVLCAAVLHDTIEDTTTDYDDLRKHFGTDVADLVAAMTKNMALPEETREPAYDRQLASASWRARLIKLADAYDNLCDSVTVPTEKQAKRKVDALDKAERALALVRGDLHEPTIAAGVEALRRLVGEERDR